MMQDATYNVRRYYAAAAIIAAAVILHFAILRDHMVDFEVFYMAGRRFLDGSQLFLASDGHFQFKYLPAAAAFFAPLSLLTPGAAKLCWTLIVMVSICASLWLSWRLVGRPNARPWFVISLTVAILLRFYGRELNLGQSNALLMLLLLGTVACIRAGNDARAGVWLGLAIALKPYALLFVPYLMIIGRRRTALTSLAVTAGMIILPLGRYGWSGTMDLYDGWLATLSSSTPQLLMNIDNASLFGMYTRWFGVANSGVANILACATAAILGAIFLVAVIRRKRRGDPAHFAVAAEVSFLLTMIVLLAPQGWFYMFLLATPAVMLIIMRLRSFPAPLRYLLVAVLAVVALAYYDVLQPSLYQDFMYAGGLTLCFLVLSGVLLGLMFGTTSASTADEETVIGK